MNYLMTSLVLILNLFAINNCAPLTKNEVLDLLSEYGFTKTSDVENIIKTYQRIFNLPETGRLDAATLAQMSQKMCGRPDGVPIKNNFNIWEKNHLTYRIVNGPVSGTLNKMKIKDELRKAFNVWSQHIPVSFEETDGFSDIEVRFIDPEKGDRSDGPHKTLAFAYYPENGDIYFDAEDWNLDSSKGINFQLVAVHEIGHSLGLGHSKNINSLMYATYKPFGTGWTLHESDISRIKALYNKDYVCQNGQIDGIFPHNDSMIVVKGQYCWNFEKNQIKDGYPKLCKKLWSYFPAKFDAIFEYDDKINFFLGNQLYFYENNEKTKVDFSKYISKKIDTALIIHERLYIFEGSKYWAFLRKNKSWTKKSDAKDISSFWKGIPSNLDAAIFDNKKNAYFFKNSNVYKFDIDSKKTVKSGIKINEYFQC